MGRSLVGHDDRGRTRFGHMELTIVDRSSVLALPFTDTVVRDRAYSNLSNATRCYSSLVGFLPVLSRQHLVPLPPLDFDYQQKGRGDSPTVP